MRQLLASLLFLLAIAPALAQAVRWEQSDTGDPSEVLLVFQDCTPEGDPKLPRIDGVTLTLAGTSSQTMINNFSLSRSTILTYRVRSTKSVPLQIPAFDVQTNKGSIRVAAFTGGTPRSASDLNINATLAPGKNTLWAGEVFPLTYTLNVNRRHFSQLGTNVNWSPGALVVEEWSNPEPTESVLNGEPRLAISYRTRAYAKTPGPLELEAANQLVNVQTGSVGFGLFQAPRVEQLTVTTDRPRLNIRPLPPAPADFVGAVGQFKLVSKVVPEQATVGEPITWTLELNGTGNWPDIGGLPARSVSKNFQVIQPQAKRTAAEGKLFDVTLSEDVVLMPTQPGTYTLGPVSFVYFDPAAGAYKTLTTPRTTLTIAPAAPDSASAAPAQPSASGQADTAPAASPFADLKAKVPTAPSGLPRDPLAGSLASRVPLSSSSLVGVAGAAIAAVIVFWLALATRRARATDPLNPQRAARQRLAETIAQIARTSGAERSTLLLRWQHDTAQLWSIPHAAPAATAFAQSPEWMKLWTEADRALYSAEAELPADWSARASAALAAKTVPGFSPTRIFLPRNLFPFVAAIALAALTVFASTGHAAERDPAAAYRAGDFETAATAWQKLVRENPTDAAARYNLSLTLAQQDRWAEAAAHAAAAFVQAPAEPAIQWQFTLASQRAGFVPAPLARFLPPGPAEKFAAKASAGTWQFVYFGALLLAAASVGVMITRGYRGSFGRIGWASVSVLALAVVLGAASLGAAKTYGTAAHRDAVIVWRTGTLRSIPTEADNTQKTSPLPAGSLAVSGKTLLGWVQLTFDNGQTGWVRKEEVIGLWK